MSRKRKYEDTFSYAQVTVSDMIDNLASSVFRWSNLPPDLMPSSEMLELMLTKYGMLGAFDTNLGLQVLQCVIPGVNQWGLPAEGSAKPIIIGGSIIPITVNPDGNMPIILYDQPSHRVILGTLQWFIDALGKLRQAIDSCTRWLKTPMIFQGNEEQEETIYNLVSKIEAGYPAVAIHKGSIQVGDIVITPTNVTPAILEALHNSYERIKAMLFEEIGVPDYNSTKQAQQTSTEIILPMLAVALKTMNRLAMRREWADKVNAIYGTKISVQALSLGLIEQSIFSSTGNIVNLQDLNSNGIPDRLEVAKNE